MGKRPWASDLRAAAGLPPRKLAIAAVRWIITFSSDAQLIIEAMTPKEQNAYFAKAAEEAADHFGADIASLVVHRDEAGIHAHFCLPAADRGGR